MGCPYSYIAFEGPIGAETRKLTNLVAEKLDAETVMDLSENPFLEDFYKDKNGAAFQAQLFFLLNRYQIMEDLKQVHLFQQVKVSNFIIEKDRIYAYQTLNDDELKIYEKIYPKLISEDRVRPDLVVYLQMSVDNIMENLRRRKNNRSYNISAQYVAGIVEAYNTFFFQYSDTPLIILNANGVQFDRDEVALEDLLSNFESGNLRGVNYLTPRTK
jgi:deoxyadenosine/deoxycytidine kinase